MPLGHPSGQEKSDKVLDAVGCLGSAGNAVSFRNGGCVPGGECGSEAGAAVDSRRGRKYIFQGKPGDFKEKRVIKANYYLKMLTA